MSNTSDYSLFKFRDKQVGIILGAADFGLS